MTGTIDPEIARVLGPGVKSVNRTFAFEGIELITQYMPCKTDCDTLIVRFHGAIQRDKRALPAFQANLKQMEGYAHQITICDPTMMTRDGFPLGWYAGHDAMNLQQILRKFFAQLRTFLGVRRIIYLGSSGGGFAALYYSYYDEKSAAVVMVPQTRIDHHIPGVIDKYINNCWPGRSLDDVSGHVKLDMCKLYANGHENSVIYVQSSGDFLHNYRQMAPFISAVHGGGDRENKKFLLTSDFWGLHGHGGAVPHEAYIPWLMSAISARSLDGRDILDAYTALNKKPVSTKPASARKLTATPESSSGHDDSALRMADLLRDYHLRQPTEGQNGIS